jgi:hypothetical protein
MTLNRLEQEDKTVCDTLYGCDGSACDEQRDQLGAAWVGTPLNAHDDNTICNTLYGCDDTTTCDDNLSLGITTIRSSDSAVSEYTTTDQTESYDVAATTLTLISTTRNHVEDLFAMAQEFESENIHFVEDKLRSAIARWENIQASRQSSQSEQVLVTTDEDSVGF